MSLWRISKQACLAKLKQDTKICYVQQVLIESKPAEAQYVS